MIRNKFYAEQATPNTVSADRSPVGRSFLSTVHQSGKPLMDFEHNLHQDIQSQLRGLVERFDVASGFLRGQQRTDGLGDFGFFDPAGIGFIADAFTMRKMVAMVAGYPVVVEFTNTTTGGENIVQLDAAPPATGGAPDSKRTDFVFLEVWPALVGASVKAEGAFEVLDPLTVSPGDQISVDGVTLTAIANGGLVGIDEFEIGLSAVITAANIASAITTYVATVTANAYGALVIHVVAVGPGSTGNGIPISITSGAGWTVSGPFLTGGVDQPNKPSQDKLYHHGNVLSPLGVALDDDLLDPSFNSESGIRVQLQYRIRVTGSSEAVNYKTQPDGFSNPSVLAQGGAIGPVADYPFVPADNSSILSNSSATAYGIVDPGLWISGDGSSSAATALQSLSGQVYAIPLCFAFRLNDATGTGGFDPASNTNGAISATHGGFVNSVIGAIPAGESDRPDSLFHDAINTTNLLDLRRTSRPNGHDLSAELTYQIQSLLDGQMRTWAIDMADKQALGGGTGNVSTQPLVCNEIGRLQGTVNPGVSGDTPRGVSIRSFDHMARRFGSQPVVERMVFEIRPRDREFGPAVPPGQVNTGKFVAKNGGAPVDSPQPNGGWYEGDTLVIDLDALNATTVGDFDQGKATDINGFIGVFVPLGTMITDVLSVRHDDGNWASPVSQEVQVRNITGLGTKRVEVVLDNNLTDMTGGRDPLGLLGAAAAPYATYPAIAEGANDEGSPRPIFVELEVSYPLGFGLTDTPDVELSPALSTYPNGPIIENNPALRPADMDEPLRPKFREGFREVGLEYIAGEDGAPGAALGTITTIQVVSNTRLDLFFPRRVFGENTKQVGVTDVPATTAKPIDVVNTEYGSSSRLVKTSSNLSGPGQTLCTVTFWAQDPIPNYGATGYQISLYYRTNAPQTAGVRQGSLTLPTGLLPSSLTLEPLLPSPHVWSGQMGPGSVERGFPYTLPLDQIPINDALSPIGGPTLEAEWFFAGSSKISVSDFDADVGMLKLHSFVALDGTQEMVFETPLADGEFRAFYSTSDAARYRPTAMAQPLSGSSRHKVFTAMLARITSDETVLFRTNEVVLVVLTRVAELDADNTVRFVDTDNRTGAAIYRTRNLLLLASG